VDRVHLVGVGGAGLSGLARLLAGAGVEVTGSDERESIVTRALADAGIEVAIGHRASNVVHSDGWCVMSAAVPRDNEEVCESRRMGLACMLYAEAVGAISTLQRTLAVAGTHGKTTTTALTVAALRGAGIDPSHLIGGEIPELGGNGYAGRDEVFVVEACEFNRSFHQLEPFAAAILNVDADHFDCYPVMDDLETSFAEYASRIRSGGALVVHDSVGDSVLRGIPRDVRLLRVGAGLYSDLRAVSVTERQGRFRFAPEVEGRRLPEVELSLRGAFQVNNALAALGLALAVGADPEGACAGLSSFRGVRRRFEVREGPAGGVLINDYAHHPAEIRAVLQTARRSFPGQRLLVAFQPHQHQRTRMLLPEFASALRLADVCVVADIYGARESDEEKRSVSAGDLVMALRELGGVVEPGGSVADLAALIDATRRSGDVVLILGAGDIDAVVEGLVPRL
jgi:UDP-N-acetylmuramate--alanine ligase